MMIDHISVLEFSARKTRHFSSHVPLPEEVKNGTPLLEDFSMGCAYDEIRG